MMPTHSQPRLAEVFATARMTAFKPGQSPPPVTTPIRLLMRLRQRCPWMMSLMAFRPFACNGSEAAPREEPYAFVLVAAVNDVDAVVHDCGGKRRRDFQQ